MDPKLRERMQEHLSRAVESVASRRRRQEILDELETHVLDAYDDAVASGQDPVLALEAALARVGDLAPVRESFARVYPPFYRQPVFWAAMAFLGFSTWLPLTLQALSRELEHRWQERDERILRRIEEFEADQAALTRLVQAFPAEDAADFGRVMNFRVPWEGLEIDARYRGPKLPEPVTTALRSKNWLERSEAPTVRSQIRSIDTAWMKTLSQYGYWEVFENSPVAPLLTRNSFNSSTVPIPDYRWITEMAKIHLIQGLSSRDPRPALRNVRHLVRLLFTNEILVANIMAIQLFHVERDAVQWAVARGRLRAGEWRTLDPAQVQRYKRATFAARDLFDFVRKPAYLKRILDSRAIGNCGAFNEALMGLGYVRALLEPRWPLESDYRWAFRGLDKRVYLDTDGCRLTVGRAQWEHPLHVEPADFLDVEAESDWRIRLLRPIATLPYARRVAARWIRSTTQSLSPYWNESP